MVSLVLRPAHAVGISASLGGLSALSTLLPYLSPSNSTLYAVVQHRAEEAESRLVHLISKKCSLPVVEPDDKDIAQPGVVALAPAGYHLLLDGPNWALSTGWPVCYARPSADVLFESLADAYGARAWAVVLTSSSADGAEGAAAVRAAGGTVLVQDPKTAEAPTGPLAVLQRLRPDFCGDLTALGDLLANCNGERESQCVEP